VNASWRFAGCANAIKGDLVRQGAFASAHICGKNCFPQSTLVSSTRLADRTSMRDSVTLDVVLVFNNANLPRQNFAATRNFAYDTDFGVPAWLCDH
jgi:hypothetical protein